MLSLHYNYTVHIKGYPFERIALLHLLKVNREVLTKIASFSDVDNLIFWHVDQGLSILDYSSFKSIDIIAA